MDRNECLFCKIVDGKIPGHIISETDGSLAFLDIMPVTDAFHIQVVPKKHYRHVFDQPTEELNDFFAHAQQIINNLREAGHPIRNQVLEELVQHAHFQIIVPDKSFNEALSACLKSIRLPIDQERLKEKAHTLREILK